MVAFLPEALAGATHPGQPRGVAVWQWEVTLGAPLSWVSLGGTFPSGTLGTHQVLGYDLFHPRALAECLSVLLLPVEGWQREGRTGKFCHLDHHGDGRTQGLAAEVIPRRPALADLHGEPASPDMGKPREGQKAWLGEASEETHSGERGLSDVSLLVPRPGRCPVTAPPPKCRLPQPLHHSHIQRR